MDFVYPSLPSADTGANGFAFINTTCAMILQSSSPQGRTLVRPITTKGFDGRQGKPVTHFLTLHLSLERPTPREHPVLDLDLGSHDVILGLKWIVLL